MIYIDHCKTFWWDEYIRLTSFSLPSFLLFCVEFSLSLILLHGGPRWPSAWPRLDGGKKDAGAPAKLDGGGTTRGRTVVLVAPPEVFPREDVGFWRWGRMSRTQLFRSGLVERTGNVFLSGKDRGLIGAG